MNGLHIFIKLRDILADLYLDETSARRVATDAGLDLRYIEFSNRAINNWQAILIQAEKNRKVDALLEIVCNDYAGNQELQEIYETYCKFMSSSTQATLLPLETFSGSEPTIDALILDKTLRQRSFAFFLIALLLEGTIAISCYDLYLYTAKLKAPGTPFLWLSFLIPLIIGIGVGFMATMTKNFKNYVLTGLGAGLLNSTGVAISLSYYLREGTSVIDWEKIFYPYFIAPIFCIIAGGIMGSWLKQHIRVSEVYTHKNL